MITKTLPFIALLFFLFITINPTTAATADIKPEPKPQKQCEVVLISPDFSTVSTEIPAGKLVMLTGKKSGIQAVAVPTIGCYCSARAYAKVIEKGAPSSAKFKVKRTRKGLQQTYRTPILAKSVSLECYQY